MITADDSGKEKSGGRSLASTSLEPFYGCKVLSYQIQALRSQGLDVVIEEHDRARVTTGN